MLFSSGSYRRKVSTRVERFLLVSVNYLLIIQCLGLWVGAICHDIDHRGFNNKFMIDVKSPLAGVYSSSTMENHHFSMGVAILQQEANNIFDNLNYEEYNEVLQTMKACILATDLALFFPNKARLADVLDTDSFDWANPEHR